MISFPVLEHLSGERLITVQTCSSASGIKLSTLPDCSFPSRSHHWIWTVKLWYLEIQLGLDREPCLQILYTEAPLPDDARWRPQAKDKTIWMIPTRLHQVAWWSEDQLVMLRESKSSYWKSHCKAQSHEFGCPGNIQPLFKLSHGQLGHRGLFSTTAVG